MEVAASALGFWEYQVSCASRHSSQAIGSEQKKQEIAWHQHKLDQKDKQAHQMEQLQNEKLVINWCITLQLSLLETQVQAQNEINSPTHKLSALQDDLNRRDIT